jgi:hypothetical protein
LDSFVLVLYKREKEEGILIGIFIGIEDPSTELDLFWILLFCFLDSYLGEKKRKEYWILDIGMVSGSVVEASNRIGFVLHSFVLVLGFLSWREKEEGILCHSASRPTVLPSLTRSLFPPSFPPSFSPRYPPTIYPPFPLGEKPVTIARYSPQFGTVFYPPVRQYIPP